LDLRRRKWRENGEDCIIRSFINCQDDHIKKHERGRAGHVAHIGEMYTKFWSENPMGRDNLEGEETTWKT